MHSHGVRPFVPAFGIDLALPLYDTFVSLVGLDWARRAILDDPSPSASFLDVGCGTGTFALQLRRAHPDARVVGLDPDPHALRVAREKAARLGLALELDLGYADALPYGDATIDRVTSTFAFHHVPAEQQPAALREMRRVLRPGGRLDLLDVMGRAAARDVATSLEALGFADVRVSPGPRLLFGLLPTTHVWASVVVG